MQLTRRSRVRAKPVTGVVNGDLAGLLAKLGRSSFSGSVEATDKDTGAKATLYLWEGGLYSAALDAYQPDVIHRLSTAGHITTEQAARLGRIESGPRAGVLAVDDGLVTVEALAAVHRELLLATAGAVLMRPRLALRRHPGAVTEDLCTLPLSTDDVITTVTLRDQRMRGTAEALGTDVDVSRLVLARAPGQDAPPRGAIPEAAALMRAVDGVTSLDALAARLGLTRAEATHIAAVGLGQRMLEVLPVAPANAALDGLPVPEAFGADTPAAPPEAPVPASPPPVAVREPVTAQPSPPSAVPTTPPEDALTILWRDVEERVIDLQEAVARQARASAQATRAARLLLAAQERIDDVIREQEAWRAEEARQAEEARLAEEARQAKADAERVKAQEVQARQQAKADAERVKAQEAEARQQAKADAERVKAQEAEARQQAKADAERVKAQEAEARQQAKAEAERVKAQEVQARQQAKADAERVKAQEAEARQQAKAEAERVKAQEVQARQQAKAEAEQVKAQEAEARQQAKAEAERVKAQEVQARQQAKAEAEQVKAQEAQARQQARAQRRSGRRGWFRRSRPATESETEQTVDDGADPGTQA